MCRRLAIVAITLGVAVVSPLGSAARSTDLEPGESSELSPPPGGYAELYRPESDLEHRLMSDLACTCGGCKLEPIDECSCPFAARMRHQVKESLADYDLSTGEWRASAYEEVRSAFVEHYGKQVVRHQPASASLAPFALAVAAVVVVAAVLFVVRRKTRREVV